MIPPHLARVPEGDIRDTAQRLGAKLKRSGPRNSSGHAPHAVEPIGSALTSSKTSGIVVSALRAVTQSNLRANRRQRA